MCKKFNNYFLNVDPNLLVVFLSNHEIPVHSQWGCFTNREKTYTITNATLINI